MRCLVARGPYAVAEQLRYAGPPRVLLPELEPVADAGTIGGLVRATSELGPKLLTAGVSRPSRGSSSRPPTLVRQESSPDAATILGGGRI